MQLVVVGGGCFGTYHARQLLRARLPGAVVTVVDRNPGCRAVAQLGDQVDFVPSDWLAFLNGWLGAADPEDRLVPAPLAPHLLWEWLATELDARPVPAPRAWGLPYEVPGRGGEVYLSAAAWTCPATCIEPGHCPVLHGPRDWDLADLIEARALELGLMPAVFRCLHFRQGVGTIRAADPQSALERARRSPGATVLAATSSRCHAAVGALRSGQ